jgi:hypothetical protein
MREKAREEGQYNEEQSKRSVSISSNMPYNQPIPIPSMHSERSNYKKKKISQRPGTHETKTQHQMQPKTEKKTNNATENAS